MNASYRKEKHTQINTNQKVKKGNHMKKIYFMPNTDIVVLTPATDILSSSGDLSGLLNTTEMDLIDRTTWGEGALQ